MIESDYKEQILKVIDTMSKELMDAKIHDILSGLIGCKIKFPKDNDIFFGLDHSFYGGIPANITFTIQDIIGNDLKLIAPKYGGKPYGRGAILLNLQILSDCLKRRQNEKAS